MNSSGFSFILTENHGTPHGDCFILKNETAPLVSGCLLLIGFGAAYAYKKRREGE